MIYHWLLLLTAASSVNSFVTDVYAPIPKLQDHAKAQTDCKLQIRLDIGKNIQDAARFVLDGLQLNLLQSKLPIGSTQLPGVSGINPQQSSGAREIHVEQNPFFIGMNGKETVQFQKGGWEMVWKGNSAAGTITCGFDIIQKVIRNKAELPAGRLFISFPLMTQKVLAEQTARKLEAEQKAKELRQTVDDKLLAMQQTGNLIKKAFLYREAAVAYEKMEMTGFRMFQWIPEMDAVTAIQNGLLVGNKGSIWLKPKETFGKHKYLGEAVIRNAVPVKSELKP